MHELKETETKLEEICEKIQIALTSLGDTDRLEQLGVWLDTLVEEALTTKTDAARYLDARIMIPIPLSHLKEVFRER